MAVDGTRLTNLQIGRYQVLEELGRGGMGIVYRAFEPILKRTVALKVLAPTLASQSELVSRLRHEAISAARLRHPNIILLYEFVQEEDLAYLAMEYAPGSSLRQTLEAGPLPIPRALHILEQIAGALDYAHSLGVIHRDIKPNNILIGPDGHAMLVDFGLAEMADNSLITPDGVVLGTPNYMSPEQAAGRVAQANSDQYSLAAVAYEMLTGVPPFHYNAPAAVIHAHIYELSPQATENNPSLPSQVNHVFTKALSKSPGGRYACVADFVADLQKSMTPPERSQAPFRKRRFFRWMIACGFLLAALPLILLAAGINFLPGAGQPEKNLPTRIAWSFNPGYVGGPKLVPAAGKLIVGTYNGHLIVLQASDGKVLWQTGNDGMFYGYPAANSDLIFVGDQLERVRGLSLARGGTVWSTKLTGKVQLAPILFQDRLIAATSKGYLYMLNAGNGRVVWSRPFVMDISSIEAAPGYLIVSSSESLYALDIESGMVIWEFKTNSTIRTRPTVVQGLVIVGTEQGRLNVIRLEDGIEQWQFQASGTLLSAPAVAGQRLFIPDQSGKISAIDIQNKKVLWQFDAGCSLESTPLVFDQYLIFGSNSGKVTILRAQDGLLLDQIQLNTSIQTDLVREQDLIFIRGDQIYAFKP